MVFEREYSIGRLDREVGGQRESRLGSQEEVETAWNLIEWDVETRLPGFASFPSVRTGREGREGGEEGSKWERRRGGEGLFLAYPPGDDPPWK